MANLDPWSYAEKTKTEHAEQVALFMWANMARMFGPIVANRPEAYAVKGWAKTWFEHIERTPTLGESKPIPELKWLHAIHNQGHGDAVRGGKAKAEGVKAGVGDVFLPVVRYPGLIASRMMHQPPYAVPETAEAYAGFYAELKRKDGGRPSEIQLEFQTDMRAAGYKAEIIHGWELARDEILRYLGRHPS